MRKITVRDDLKEFHSFTGHDIAFYVGDLGAEVVEWFTDETTQERRQKKLAFFGTGQFMWIKEGDLQTSHNAPRTSGPSGFPGPAGPVGGPSGLPGPAGPHGPSGRDAAPPRAPRDADPFTEAAMAGAAPMAPDFKTLSPRPATEVTERLKEEALVKQYDALAAAEKPKRKRVRPSRAKPKQTTQPERDLPADPELDDRKGFERAIDDHIADAGKVMQPSAQDDQDVELFPDPDKVIGEAEARYTASRKPPCVTCHNTGLMRDPSSEDPLDTVQCPDC